MTKKPILPDDPKLRKGAPITTGVIDYFPLAVAEVARISVAGNEQHNPGEPLHWAMEKSTDHADCIPRHLIDRGTRDSDGQRHSGKLAWRSLALLEIELRAEAAGVSTEEFIAKLKADAKPKLGTVEIKHIRPKPYDDLPIIPPGHALTRVKFRDGVERNITPNSAYFWGEYGDFTIEEYWTKVVEPLQSQPPL